MNDIVRAILLGAVQALTEFFPVSSSAHLALLGPLLGDHDSSLTLDVALHGGTAAAVVLFFAGDWINILRGGATDLREHGLALRRWSPPGRLGALVAIGTIPALVVGGLFGDMIEDQLRAPTLIAVALVAGALAMAAADRWGRAARGVDDLTPLRSIVIGLGQALALIPGVSRSGVTITAGRALGMDRPAAVRFSFLLSIPVIVGAVARQAMTAVGSPDVEWLVLAVGALTAFALGLVAIRLLLALVTSGTLMPFVWYRLVLAGAIVVSLWM